MAAGHPEDALVLFSRSLAKAETDRNDKQSVFDLCSITLCLMALDQPIKALESLGLAQAHATQAYGTTGFTERAVGAERIAAAIAKVGPAATEIRTTGWATPPAERGARARQLADLAYDEAHAGFSVPTRSTPAMTTAAEAPASRPPRSPRGRRRGCRSGVGGRKAVAHRLVLADLYVGAGRCLA